MGIVSGKELKRKISEATSNSSLSNLRYVITERPKWKVFKKREVKVIPAYHTSFRRSKGCPCGNSEPCKQKVTPRGVTIHYPQKKKKYKTMSARNYKSAKIDKGYLNTRPRPQTSTKIYRNKSFPTWRLDKLAFDTPYVSTVQAKSSS